jgi:hypothetical protein
VAGPGPAEVSDDFPCRTRHPDDGARCGMLIFLGVLAIVLLTAATGYFVAQEFA